MTCNYDIEAQPTSYAGLQFRSKLEAQWAAWFDRAKVSWVYEPERLGQWMPDFLVNGTIYAEVKPVPRLSIGGTSDHFDWFSKAVSPRWSLLLGDGPVPYVGLLIRALHERLEERPVILRHGFLTSHDSHVVQDGTAAGLWALACRDVGISVAAHRGPRFSLKGQRGASAAQPDAPRARFTLSGRGARSRQPSARWSAPTR